MPNHRINLDVARLDAYYEQMMDDVFLMHHTYPTNLTHMNLTQADLAALAVNDAWGRAAIAQQAGNRSLLPSNATLDYDGGMCRVTFWRDGKPIKKKTYFQSDPGYSNGLPTGGSVAMRQNSDIGCGIGIVLVIAVWVALLVWVLL